MMVTIRITEELYDYLVWKRDDRLVPPVGTAGEDA